MDGVDVDSGFGWKVKERRSVSPPSEVLKFEQKKKKKIKLKGARLSQMVYYECQRKMPKPTEHTRLGHVTFQD